MCGRYTLISPSEALMALFDVSEDQDWDEPRYNIAPQTKIMTLRRRGATRVAQPLLWGAINPRDSKPLINARSETVATSPLFARAFLMSRILIPADGFFEWTNDRGQRKAHYFQPPDGRPFAFAGLAINTPANANEDREEAAVILTTAASPPVRPYHHRMPLVIAPGDFAQWLDRDTKPKAAIDLIASGAGSDWKSVPVGPAVNNVRNDRPDCIAPAAHLPNPQGSLF